MRPRDRYDYIGISLLVLLGVVWALHLILPAPPPEEAPPPGGLPQVQPFPR